MRTYSDFLRRYIGWCIVLFIFAPFGLLFATLTANTIVDLGDLARMIGDVVHPWVWPPVMILFICFWGIGFAFATRLWVMGIETAEDRRATVRRCLKIDLLVSLPLGVATVIVTLFTHNDVRFAAVIIGAMIAVYLLAELVYAKMGPDAFPGYSERRAVWQMAMGFGVLVASIPLPTLFTVFILLVD